MSKPTHSELRPVLDELFETGEACELQRARLAALELRTIVKSAMLDAVLKVYAAALSGVEAAIRKNPQLNLISDYSFMLEDMRVLDEYLKKFVGPRVEAAKRAEEAAYRKRIEEIGQQYEEGSEIISRARKLFE